MDAIPVIDVSPVLDGGDPSSSIAAFRDAYGQLGFGYITGHGIDRALIDAVFAQSRAFHALPLDAKMALAAGTDHRGYIPMAASTDRTSTLAEVTKPNQSASFMIMEDSPVGADWYLAGANRWPELEGFRATVDAYRAKLSDLARYLLKIALWAADIDDHSSLAAFDRPTTWLRLLHYPPRANSAPDDLFGSAPHTDFGALTLLAQDPVGGLEVMAPDGTWLDAPYCADAFVVNVGDMLHRMTNGRLRSTPHRVINRSGRERYSCPFFFDPHVDTTIAPLPGTGAPTFPPIRFDTFLRGELEASYDAHRPDNL